MKAAILFTGLAFAAVNRLAQVTIRNFDADYLRVIRRVPPDTKAKQDECVARMKADPRYQALSVTLQAAAKNRGDKDRVNEMSELVGEYQRIAEGNAKALATSLEIIRPINFTKLPKPPKIHLSWQVATALLNPPVKLNGFSLL